MKQLTRKQAIALYDSDEWKAWEPRQLAEFQLQQDRLCVPANDFKHALSTVLRRPIYTHDLADAAGLLRELRGESTPTRFFKQAK